MGCKRHCCRPHNDEQSAKTDIDIITFWHKRAGTDCCYPDVLPLISRELRNRWNGTISRWYCFCSQQCSVRSWSTPNGLPLPPTHRTGSSLIGGGCTWSLCSNWGALALSDGCSISVYCTCRRKSALFGGQVTVVAGRDIACVCTLGRLCSERSTFAFGTVVVLRNGFLFQEVFQHFQQLAVVIISKV